MGVSTAQSRMMSPADRADARPRQPIHRADQPKTIYHDGQPGLREYGSGVLAGWASSVRPSRLTRPGRSRAAAASRRYGVSARCRTLPRRRLTPSAFNRCMSSVTCSTAPVIGARCAGGLSLTDPLTRTTMGTVSGSRPTAPQAVRKASMRSR